MKKFRCIDEKGKYYPWVYRAYNAANGPSSIFQFEDPFTAFEKTYKGRFTYQWDGKVKEFMFDSEDDATMFMLKFL